MEVLLGLAVVVFGVALVLVLIKGKSKGYSYQLSRGLLSKAERSFYGVLVQAVGSNGIVFAKVRVADVINPKKGMSRSDWQRAFNQISAKHFDFVVCDPGDLSKAARGYVVSEIEKKIDEVRSTSSYEAKPVSRRRDVTGATREKP